jgi:hypothetical protein
MRKSILTLIIFAFANSIFAQVDKNLIEAQKRAIMDAIIKTDQDVLKTPTKPKPWLERAIAYLDLASFPDSTVSLKDPKASFKALDFISEAIKLDTKDGTKGSIAKEAENLINGKNKAYIALVNMGVIKYQGKDYLSSLRYMSKASELAPNDTTSAMYTGVIAQLCQKNAEARKGYEYYISIGGKDVAIIYGLAQIYKVAKEEDAALSMIDKGIVIYPSNTDLRNERFNMLISFNRLDEAIKLLEKNINYGGNDFKSMYNLTQLYIMNREDKKAKELQDKVISLYGIDKWEKANKNKDGRWEEEVNITKESSTKQKEEVNNIITEEKKESPVAAKENVSPKEEEKKEESNVILAKIFSKKKSIVTPDARADITKDKEEASTLAKSEKTRSLIPYKVKNGFYNISKSINAIVDKTNYDEIIPTYFNCLKVRKDELWGLINTKGELIVPVKYQSIVDENFNYILASNYYIHEGFHQTNHVFNRNGIKIWELEDGGGKDDNLNKKILKNIITIEVGNHAAGFTILDKNITKYIKTGWEFLTQFNEYNNAIIHYYSYFEGDREVALIDSDNNILFKTKYIGNYDILKYLGEDMYSLEDKSGLLALIDKLGNRQTPFKFENIREFKNNRALVESKGYIEFINKQGKTIIKLGNELAASEIQDFENNLSVNSINILDTLGQKIKLPILDVSQKILINTYHSNHFNYRNQNGKYGVLSTNGKIIVSAKYDDISKFKYGYAIVKTNDKYGIINDFGKEILKVKYDKINCLIKNELGELKYHSKIYKEGDFIVFNELINVELNGEAFYVDISGNEFYEK